ncbi:MAG: class I SAM-dependent methyltransferase [Blastocatellia bacterium]|nr:class I SAM-dependent methyltransferase [Blastocatellia bacterium]
MNRSPNQNESSAYVQPDVGGIVSRVVWRARVRMFSALMEQVKPTSEIKVLDVGVTCDRRPDSNFFEKLYPFPHNITAVGLEDASFLEQEFPGVRFLRANGKQLPFPDKSFDLVVSFAVLEHVGNRLEQQRFVRELCRVGKQCYITTPNRWHPIEFHTVLPLVHWLPPKWFRVIARLLGKDFFASEANLNLLDDREVSAMFPNQAKIAPNHHRLGGFISNLVYLVTFSDTGG